MSVAVRVPETQPLSLQAEGAAIFALPGSSQIMTEADAIEREIADLSEERAVAEAEIAALIELIAKANVQIAGSSILGQHADLEAVRKTRQSKNKHEALLHTWERTLRGIDVRIANRRMVLKLFGGQLSTLGNEEAASGLRAFQQAVREIFGTEAYGRVAARARDIYGMNYDGGVAPPRRFA